MARSLSLVSRHFHDASRSVRMQSVICNGADEIIAFASILDRTPAHLRVVRHLFATFTRLPGSYETTSGREPPSSIWRSVAIMLSPRRTADRIEPIISLANTIHSSLLRILTVIAPTLRTLSLVIDVSTWSRLPFPSALPALVELSIQHAFAGGCLRGDAFDSIASVSSLRRLTLAGFLRVIDPLGLVDSIKRFAPMLTHIGVPAEPGNIKPMIHRIATAMERNGMQSEKVDGIVFPETLECLFIEASPVGDPPSHIMANGDRQIICANRTRSRRMEYPGEMRLHWLARMDGKAGYWKIDAKVEDIVERLDIDHLMLSIQFNS